MSFVHPTYLWTLLGLLIPLAIHLWSKKEGKTIKIGSTKLLSEEDSKQSSSISLNELLLLLLRLLIVGLVVLIMAEPQLKKESKNADLTYIVEPSLVNHSKVNTLLDSLKEDHPVLLLQKEFPSIEKLIRSDSLYCETPNYWQLAKEMETLKTDSIIVFTNAFLNGLKGKRPTINKSIDWIIFDTTQPEEHAVEAVLKEDSIQFLSTRNSPENVSFSKEMRALNSSSIKLNKTKDSLTLNKKNRNLKYPLLKAQTYDVLLYSEDNFYSEARYLETAINTISNYLKTTINIYKSADSTSLDLTAYDKIIWLSKAYTPQTTVDVLLYKIDDLSRDIISQSETPNLWHITHPINPENILNKEFSKQLLSWLNLYPRLEKRIAPLDTRKVSKAALLPIHNNDGKKSNLYIETWSLAKWLCLMLALLFICERLIAYQKKQ